ncbi:hypothetical protein [Microbulbifer sp. SSSA005]|uniref:hypothetical protein n=1 Tax=unclassified Microbulbifer TaxID=2619833 RepID=UPI00403A4969
MPFQLDHYLELLEWSGRQLHPKKRGAISENIPPILNRLGISPKHWLYLNCNFESRFKRLVGSAEAVHQACAQQNKRWVHGRRDCQRFLAKLLKSASTIPRFHRSRLYTPLDPLWAPQKNF